MFFLIFSVVVRLVGASSGKNQVFLIFSHVFLNFSVVVRLVGASNGKQVMFLVIFVLGLVRMYLLHSHDIAAIFEYDKTT